MPSSTCSWASRFPSHQAHHERYTKSSGLAILSSDALSSVAYATEEILRTLLIAGTASLWLVTPIGCVIAGLMLVIAFSYRQTIHAYPGGGGAYRVARENIGTTAGLVAAAALLLDYVLTVAVSIAAGVAAITSAFPHGTSTPWSCPSDSSCSSRSATCAGSANRRASSPCRPTSSSAAWGSCSSSGLFKVLTGDIAPIESAAAAFVPHGGGVALDLPRAPRVRERVHGADGNRGDLGRGPRVQAAGGQERRDHAPDHGGLRGGAASWASRSSRMRTRSSRARTRRSSRSSTGRSWEAAASSTTWFRPRRR